MLHPRGTTYSDEEAGIGLGKGCVEAFQVLAGIYGPPAEADHPPLPKEMESTAEASDMLCLQLPPEQ